MGFLDRVERSLERAVKAPFARVFRAEVQPVEIASAVRGAMDDRAAVLGPGRTMVPNVFTVELADTDYERLSSYDRALTDELVAAAEDHAETQRYTPAGTVQVRLVKGEDLETGIFRVRPTSRDDRGGGRSRPGRRERATAAPEPAPRRSERAGAAPAGSGGGAGDRPRPAHLRGAASSTGTPGHEPSEGDTGDLGQEQADHTRQLSAAGSGRGRPVAWLEADGDRHPLTGAVTTIGRDPSAAIVLDDPGVSRRHAELRIRHDGPHLQLLVRDLGSTNGTFVNGDEIGTEELSDGDRLTIGRTTLVVHVDRGR